MSNVPDDLWTLDAHCDSVILRFCNGDPVDLSPVETDYHVTVPRLRAGGMTALWTMVGDRDLVESLRMIQRMHTVCETQPDTFALCLGAGDVRAAVAAGRIAVVLTIEGQSMFGDEIDLVPLWHRLGVRVYSLTHGEGVAGRPHALQGSNSFFGYVSADTRRRWRREQRGLMDFGRRSLAEMGRLGIACDLAHANDAAFWQTLECATGPVCYTHGNCYALCPHSRNMTDEMMRALAEKGGVIGPCFYGPFVDEHKPTLDRFVEHVLHALEIMGPDGVGIGSDFDGGGSPEEMVFPEPSGLGRLWEALDKRGVDRATQRKIAHDNFLRMLPDDR